MKLEARKYDLDTKAANLLANANELEEGPIGDLRAVIARAEGR
jgi:hypothetical protein